MELDGLLTDSFVSFVLDELMDLVSLCWAVDDMLLLETYSSLGCIKLYQCSIIIILVGGW